MILNDKIYDITIYKQYHPGGLEKIMMGAGKDATSLICEIFFLLFLKSLKLNIILGLMHITFLRNFK